MKAEKKIALKNICLRGVVLPDSGGYDRFINEEVGRKGVPLRYAIVQAGKNRKGRIVTVEATVLKNESRVVPSSASCSPDDLILFPIPRKPLFVHIVPTGYRAAVGGSLGDAMPVNRALASLGMLVTHPNTCNAGPLNVINTNMLYTEGRILDDWARGTCMLARQRGLKVGIIVDRTAKGEWIRNQAHNAVLGQWAHTGYPLAGIEFTKEPVGGVARRNISGAFVGNVQNLQTIFEAAERLLAAGATALAVFTYIEVRDNDVRRYFGSKIANPWGGLEAIISHSLVRRFGVPAAHGPLVTAKEERKLQSFGLMQPTKALDAANPMYLFSVLLGLPYAPQILNTDNWKKAEPGRYLKFSDATALICPASCMGGIPMMCAEELGIPIIGVKQNDTVVDVRASDLGYKNAVEVENYLEAIGLLVCHLGAGQYGIKDLRRILEGAKGTTWLEDKGKEVCANVFPPVDPATLSRPLSFA